MVRELFPKACLQQCLQTVQKPGCHRAQPEFLGDLQMLWAAVAWPEGELVQS